jgi:hypothetical protein
VVIFFRIQSIMLPATNFGQYFDHGESSSSSFLIERHLKTPPLTLPKSVRSVGFAPHDEIWEIPHFKDLSEEEVESIWMSSQELKAVRRNCLRLVQKMNFSTSLGKDSPRGLENYSKHRVDKIKQIQKAATESVLGLQKFGILKGVRVTTLMGELYSKKACQSQLDAHKRGLEDANDALKVHRKQYRNEFP